MRLNINEAVTVTLNELSARIYNEFWASPIGRNAIKSVEDGQELRIQMWELMMIYGPVIYLGMGTLFKDNVINIKETQ